MSVLAAERAHRADAVDRRARRARRARRRAADRLCQEPALGRGTCRPSTRRNHAHVFPQVTSGASTDPAQLACRPRVNNNPLNKTDPLGLRPSDSGYGAAGLCGITAVLLADDVTVVGVIDDPIAIGLCAVAVIATMYVGSHVDDLQHSIPDTRPKTRLRPTDPGVDPPPLPPAPPDHRDECVQAPIIPNEGAVAHIYSKHYSGGAQNFSGEATFYEHEDLYDLLAEAELFAPMEDGVNCKRYVDAGRPIGTPRGSSTPTSVFTVITSRPGVLVTAFPGKG